DCLSGRARLGGGLCHVLLRHPAYEFGVGSTDSGDYASAGAGGGQAVQRRAAAARCVVWRAADWPGTVVASVAVEDRADCWKRSVALCVIPADVQLLKVVGEQALANAG